MTSIAAIRKSTLGILAVGNHPPIIQSLLDFDFLSGKRTPSVVAILTEGRSAEKFFFGREEVMIPCFSDAVMMPDGLRKRVQWMLNLQSGRRAFASTERFFDLFPKASGGAIFAENIPEKFATALIKQFSERKLILGPASVGFLVPGVLKLGAIGGIDPAQIAQGMLTMPGSVAVVSTSGGMTNELIRAVTAAGKRISFAAAVGGDRFPVVSLTDVFLLAENDPETCAVVYFGELGGADEYEIVALLKARRFTKPVIAYIAGIIDEAFEEHMQFGHAKALVREKDESARAKRDALRAAGAAAPDTFSGFLEALTALPEKPYTGAMPDAFPLSGRSPSILSTREVVDTERIPAFVKSGKLLAQKNSGFVASALKALLGKTPAPLTVAFTDAVFSLLIDHGGHVSGAVNTMIAARAGKDLVSSLSAGLLTIGPRFGGAVNDAARAWLRGVSSKTTASDFVEEVTRAGKRIAGIGHRKYRVGLPDPRVAALVAFATLLRKHPHYDFARAVEKITTAKKGSLILNIDGAIAALLLDVLAEKEKLSRAELLRLADAEFFNAFFVIPRAVGFTAHFLEQKENDEGLFRLPDELLFVRKNKKQR